MAEVRWAYRLHKDLAQTLDQKLEVLCTMEATEGFADLVGGCNLLAVGSYYCRNRICDEHQQELERIGDEDLFRIPCAAA